MSKDIQQQLYVPVWDLHRSASPGTSPASPRPPPPPPPPPPRSDRPPRLRVPTPGPLCWRWLLELRRFVELTGIPGTTTLMGLGDYPSAAELSLRMLAMHGTLYANYAVDKADLLLAFGVRFNDRVTGKLEAFASRAKIVHIDIDSSEIGKNKQHHVSICADVKLALEGMNALLEESGLHQKLDFSAWREELDHRKKRKTP